MDNLFISILNFVTIQLYAYIATKHVFRRIDKRRAMRKARLNREFTDIENFGALLLSFLIAGAMFTAVSSVFPELTSLSTPIWLVDIALIIIGYFIARAWGLLTNPYN